MWPLYPKADHSDTAKNSAMSKELLRGMGVSQDVCARLDSMGIFKLGDAKNREITLSLDTAAAVTIIPKGVASQFPLEDTDSGTVYQNASGGDVPDEGMRKLTGKVGQILR